ncbi:hypothetical protein [Nannocystis pusilla]|uniref:Uncharacterized protein n=1 Tax=Nannocystis pusilla TaxID=889268 RepID=A0ABS7THP1_9BACT|nr:hypothetical protein [Nannocystis pusilla]MBZ5707742.1 hypothetical protein [Nannocystis pusilla]
MPLALTEEDPSLAAELDAIPRQVRRTVLAAGLEPVLARMLRDRRTGREGERSFLVRRQAIAMQLAALSSQLDASVYAADCLGDSAESVRVKIDADSNAREIRRTMISLIIGAAVAIGAGVWELADEEAKGRVALQIAGGAVAGSVGVAAFVDQPTPILLDHRRNLLEPVFRGEDPEHILPTFVMRMLMLPTNAGPTPRDTLLARFKTILDEAAPKDERSRAEALIFGAGGVYTPKLLHARERMLDEVESALSAFARDLELLQRWLGRAFDDGLLLEVESSGELPGSRDRAVGPSEDAP